MDAQSLDHSITMDAMAGHHDAGSFHLLYGRPGSWQEILDIAH
jgi:hypothetical protein